MVTGKEGNRIIALTTRWFYKTDMSGNVTRCIRVQNSFNKIKPLYYGTEKAR
jgi:hypothetical protein